MNGRQWAPVVLILAGLVLTAGGCVHTRISDFRDPGFARQRFHRIAVDYIERGLRHKEQGEQTLARTLEEETERLEAIPCSRIVPPTRDYSDEEFADRLRQHGCDGYLVVRLTDKEYSHHGHHGYAGMVFDADVEDLAEFILEESADNVNLCYHLELIEVESSRCVWTASSETLANEWASFPRAIRSLGRKVAGRLRAGGYVR